MTDPAVQYRLMTWLTASFPVGAFAYSHGLEWVVETGRVGTAGALSDWLADLLVLGAARTDAILCAASWRAAREGDIPALAGIAELADAMSPAMERRLETMTQGRAFVSAIETAWPCPVIGLLRAEVGPEVAYPVAVGVAAAGHGVPVEALTHAYLHAFISNLVSAGMRLVPLGQRDGQRVLAALEAPVAEAAAFAARAGLDDIGGAVFLSDIAAMNHETQYTRLFRS